MSLVTTLFALMFIVPIVLTLIAWVLGWMLGMVAIVTNKRYDKQNFGDTEHYKVYIRSLSEHNHGRVFDYNAVKPDQGFECYECKIHKPPSQIEIRMAENDYNLCKDCYQQLLTDWNHLKTNDD